MPADGSGLGSQALAHFIAAAATKKERWWKEGEDHGKKPYKAVGQSPPPSPFANPGAQWWRLSPPLLSSGSRACSRSERKVDGHLGWWLFSESFSLPRPSVLEPSSCSTECELHSLVICRQYPQVNLKSHFAFHVGPFPQPTQLNFIVSLLENSNDIWTVSHALLIELYMTAPCINYD